MSNKLDNYFANGVIDDSMNESNADMSCLSGFASFQVTDAETSNNFDTSTNNIQLKLDLNEKKKEISKEDNEIFSQFLKKSATPLSPENSLYESTLSLAKLEALDDDEIDANFMRSQTEEVEENMTQFLSTIKKTKKADFFVQDPPKYLNGDSSENDSIMCPEPVGLNQTEMDSILLKDVKNRFGLNSINETNMSVDILSNSPFQDRLKQRQSELYRDAERIAGQVMLERPNLDGSSSDSENEKTLLGSNGSVVSLKNKSKVSIDQQVDELVVPVSLLGNTKALDKHVTQNISNGCGGDGSSGHSEDDIDLSKRSKSSTKSLSSQLGSEVRVHPPNRERPVGGPGSNIDFIAKQVQFAPSPNLASTHGTSCSDEKLTLTLIEDPDNDLNVTPSPFEEQESRLSSRYFLAASTPFLGASTFSDNSPEAESRTMCLEDFQDEGSIMLNEISPNHDFIETDDGKNVSNWIEKNSHYKNGDDIFGSFSNGFAADDFEVNNKDFECMLEEDEKAVAENNDTIVKDHETSGVSEWSVRTENIQINPDLLPSVCSSNSDGNVSRYFKIKSHDLGKSIGKISKNRPKFSDATIISSPDKCSPVKLIEETVEEVQHNLHAKNETYVRNINNQQFVEPITSGPPSFKGHVISGSHSGQSEFRHPENLSKRKSAKHENAINVPQNIRSPDDESFSIPICKQEAGALLNSIRERRVSIIGMETTQMESLSKVIASLTGSDVSIVYRVLQIMSKENIPVFSGENRDHAFRKESNGHKTNNSNSFSSCNPVVSNFDGHYATPMHTGTSGPSIPVFSENSTSDNLYHTLYPSVDRESFNRIPSSQKGNNNTFKLAAVTPYQINSSHTSSSNSRQPSTSGIDSSMLYTCAAPRHMNMNIHDGLSYSSNISFGFCCLGEKTTRIFKIYNSNCCWVQVHFNIIFFAYNGCENSDHHTYPFIINPSKVVVGPNSSEEIKIKFLPKQTGTFMMKVELLAGPLVDCEDSNVNWPRLPKLLNIEGSCEIPDLEVILGDEKCIDFGEVSYGTFSSRELKIVNNGKADITVKLAISSSQSTVGFSFENSLNVASVDGNPQQSLAVIKGTGDGSIPVTPTVITIKFQAPHRPSESQKQQNMKAPEEHSCQLDIKTATEHVFSVSRVLIKAMVGYLRLHSLRTLQPICLSCAEGTQSKEVIPLRNAGNLALSLAIKICGSSGFFTAVPSQLKLLPGEESEVKILFSPDVPAYVESILKVSILPDGDEYEWTLKGKSNKSVPTVPKNKKSNLLCNTHALNWAGVSIGQSQQQKLILRNSSDNESIQLSLNIAGDNSNFQIVKDASFAQKDLNKFEAVMGPKGELPIHILFVPTYLHMANSSLVLRTLDGMNKFVIPLSGYGGKSQLDISGANNLRNQYWIDMDEVYLGKKNVMNLMLRNSGSRSAFISIKCYSDITARLEYPDTHVCITPNNFVLKEKVSTQITLSYQPLQDHAKKVQEGSYTSAHLVIYSGDEVLRKGYKKHFKGVHGNQILKHLDTQFTNEENVNEEVSYTMVSDWNNFLDACLDKTIIALVAKYPSEPSKESTQDDMQEMIVHATPAQKLKTSINKESKSSEIWSISPERIVLNSTDNAASAKLKLVNYSHKMISFEFIWPGQTLVITPCKEKIPPRSQLVVKVHARASFLSSSEDLPWKGNLYVLCNGEQKGIEVEICVDSVSLQSPMLPQNDMIEIFPNDISIIPHLSKSNEKTVDQHITLNPHILEFSKTKLGVASESNITITNQYDVPCEWNLISIAPPYCKSLDGKSTITRVTYSAFRFSKSTGSLGAKESMNLSVSFNPRAEGMYSQYWEIEVSSEKVSKSKIRLEVNGLGYNSNEEKKNNSLKGPNKSEINGHSNGIRKKSIDENRSVIVKDSLVTFPQTNVGEKTSMSFRLCNRSERVQKVTLSGLKEPFNIDHTTLTLRAKHYLRVPVYFSPQEADTVSQGSVDINLEDGSCITVKVVGKSSQG